jgi:hypothetical protein
MAKYMKWLLPVLFIAYYSSISFFTHVHIEYGTTIVHAHPFDKSSDGACHHHKSLSEIQLFHLLTTVYVEDGAVHPLLLQFYALPIYEIIESPVCPDFLVPALGHLSLRAPPAFA